MRAAITELKGAIVPNDPDVSVDVVKRGPGRPRKDPSQTVPAKQKSGRRKKREIKDGGYRLSPWDQLVIDTITKADQLITKGRLLRAALEWASTNEPEMTPKDVEDKLTVFYRNSVENDRSWYTLDRYDTWVTTTVSWIGSCK